MADRYCGLSGVQGFRIAFKSNNNENCEELKQD